VGRQSPPSAGAFKRSGSPSRRSRFAS